MATNNMAAAGAVILTAVVISSSFAGLLAVDSAAANINQQSNAEVTFSDQTSNGTSVVIDSVALPDGGFVAVREQPDRLLGVSRYLEPGRHEDVTVTLDEQLTEDTELVAAAHRDTNSNREFDFEAGNLVDFQYGIEKDEVVADSALVRVETEMQTPAEEVDLERGLVGYWKFDSESGATAVDSSENGNDGTIHGANWTDGRFGSALRFDGEDDYVNVTGSSVTEGDFTVSLWARVPSNASGSVPAAVSMGVPSVWNNELFILYAGDGGVDNGVRVWWEGNALTWDENLADGQWHHLVLVKEGRMLRLFAEGELVADGTTNGNTWTSTFSGIGAANKNGSITQAYEGRLDEVRFYDRALTRAEVEAVFNRSGNT